MSTGIPSNLFPTAAQRFWQTGDYRLQTLEYEHPAMLISTAAHRFWQIADFRLQTLRYLSAAEGRELATLDRATFGTWVAIQYSNLHFDEFCRLPFGRMRKSRLEVYLAAIRKIHITGILPRLYIYPSVMSMFQLFPGLRSIRFLKGTLRKERPSCGEADRFLCHSEFTVSWHQPDGWGMPLAQPRVEKVDTSAAIRYAFDFRFDATRPYMLDEDRLSLICDLLPPGDIRRLIIDADAVDAIDMLLVLKVLKEKRPGCFEILDIRSFVRTEEVQEDRHGWISEIPPSCKKLVVWAAQETLTLDKPIAMPFELCQNLEWIVLVGNSLDGPAQNGSWKLDRILDFECTRYPLPQKPLRRLRQFDIYFDTGEKRDCQILEMFNEGALPPMSVIATRLFALGGEGCNYTLVIDDPRDTDLMETLSTMLSRQLQQEIAWIIEKQRDVDPGWSRIEKAAGVSAVCDAGVGVA